jgi:hypothetical protein
MCSSISAEQFPFRLHSNAPFAMGAMACWDVRAFQSCLLHYSAASLLFAELPEMWALSLMTFTTSYWLRFELRVDPMLRFSQS